MYDSTAPVTFTLPADVARKLAELVFHELRQGRYDSVLHLRLDDDGDVRDSLFELALALDAA